MGKMLSVHAVVLTMNEEKNIADCIDSLDWADQVVVLDSGSADSTVEEALRLGAVVHHRPFRDFADQHNAALDLVDCDWVFFVDADERVTPQLAAEVRSALTDPIRAGWWVPRRNYIFGRLMRHTGWQPDYQLRLLKRGRARYDPRWKVHERVMLDGESGYLHNPIIHHSYATLHEFRKTQSWYADFKAEMLLDKEVKPTYHFLAAPVLEFLRRFVFLQGFRDGLHGFILSGLMAYYAFVPYVRLWRLRRSARAS